MLITTSTFSPTPLQRRSALGSAASKAAAYIMPKSFSLSEPGLPLPSSSRRRRDGGSFLSSMSPRFRKRAVVGVLCLLALFLYSSMGSSASDNVKYGADRGDSRIAQAGHGNMDKPRNAAGGNNYEKPRAPPAAAMRLGAYGHGYEREMNALGEDSMLAENEIAVDNEIEEPPKTEAELKAEKEKEKQKVITRAQEKKNQLRALVFWLAKGGQLPLSDFRPPSERELKKMTGTDLEEYLMGIEDAYQPVPNPFQQDGWEDKARRDTGVTVFSKSYCPYSRNAKSILADYALMPEPYIVELDQRDDGSYIQDMLKALTGRRTVPNIISNFESLGGSDEITLLHHEGTLKKKLLTYSLIT